MDRRTFVRRSALASAAAGLSIRSDAVLPALGQARSTGPVIDGVSPAALTDRYLDLLRQGGVTGWHKSLGDIQSFADVYNFVDQRPPRVEIATTARSIREAHRKGSIALVFGWQDADPLGSVSGQKTTPLRAFHQLGLRVVNLVYNMMNQFAGGCLEPHMGLTRIGKRLVEEIHSLRIVLDVGGHTGEQSSLDAIGMSGGVPVICSHTNMRALVDNPRNISDKLATAIARTGGVIGLTSINDFNARGRQDAGLKATPQAPLSKLLDQYDYLKRLIGIDHVGMGNDFTTGRDVRIDPTLPQFPPEMASDQQPINHVKGFETIAELPNLIAGLKERGWSDEDVAKAMGLNWLRVYQRVWGA